MNKEEIKGKAKQATGAVKEKVGQLTDDPVLEQEGVDDRADGELREGVGKLKRKVGEVVEDAGKRIKQ